MTDSRHRLASMLKQWSRWWRGRHRESRARRTASDDMLRCVLETVPDGIVTIDGHGTVLAFNPAAERLFGYRADEVIGRNVSVLMPEPYRSRHDDYLRRYLATGEARIIGKGRTVAGRRKDRSTFPLELAIARFTIGDDPYFTGIVRDATPRHDLEAELRQRLQEVADAEERMRSVVDHVLDAIITIDERGIITTFNGAAEKTFGWRSEDMIGRNVSVLMPEPDCSRHDGYLGSYLRTGQAKIIGIGREVIGRRCDGRVFPMELAISEFRIGAARYFTGIVRDLTERKRLEHELRERLDQLATAAQRKDQFIGLLGHELRNPLAPVRNGLEILRRLEGQAQMTRNVVEMMERQVAQMVRLIDDLLDISRITSNKIALKRDDVDLRRVVQQAIETIVPELGEQQQPLDVALPDAPVIACVDAVRIAQIVNNLLSNASKFSDPGARIGITLEREASYAVIRVEDEGVGIPADRLDDIFEILVQIDPSFERRRSGLGIGLTLVKSLTELHGGAISVRSPGPGRGTTFEVRLPVAATPPRETRPAEEADGAYAARRILVIDDNRDAADSLSALLRMLGHDVITVYDGANGVREAANLRSAVVLCDIGMPGMTGLEVAAALRPLHGEQDLRLIAVTGYGHPEAVREAREAGFDHHVVKPVDLNQLLPLLKSAPVPDPPVSRA